MKIDNREPVVWLNDGFVNLSEAAISPLDRGFQFGDGLFETIRADEGRVYYLKDHLERLAASAADLRIPFSKNRGWEEVIQGLIAHNNLNHKTARIKMILTRGQVPGLGLPQPVQPTILLTAGEYHPPTLEQYQDGWKLHVFRQGFSPPLARHKSLNYLYFMVARQAAADAGCDEALILGPDETVAETATGSLLINMDGQWMTPEGSCLLPGTALGRARVIMSELGLTVVDRVVSLNDLGRAESGLVLNSLMGVIPVREIDGVTLTRNAHELAARLRESLFSTPG